MAPLGTVSLWLTGFVDVFASAGALQDRLLAMTAHANIEGLEGEIEDWRSLQQIANFLSELDDPAFPEANGKTLFENSGIVIGTELGNGWKNAKRIARKEDNVLGVPSNLRLVLRKSGPKEG